MAWRLKWTLLLLFAAQIARAGDWTVVSSNRESGGAAGVAHVVAEAKEAGSGTRATVHLALFPMKTATLRVIDVPDANSDLATVMQRENCIAGVNGGYFDPEYAAVGLLVSDGRVVAPQQKARLLSGVVSVVSGRVQVQRAAEFSIKKKPTDARQCGPFLVDGGKAVPGLNNTRPARRTFVMTAAGERAAIGYCSSVTLAQLGSLVATPELVGDAKVLRALNLDGGSSTAFWFKGEGRPFSLSEQKTVRDFLAVVPRASTP